MKIAVCFFGITRNLKANTLDSLRFHLFSPVAKLDPGFRKFAHFNIVKTIHNPRSREINVPVDPDDYRLLNCDAVAVTCQEQLDKRTDFAAIERFGDIFENNCAALRNLIRQLQSLNEVTRLLRESGEHFDVVIYSRADIRFATEVALPGKILPRTVYSPWFSRGGGCNDRFALGDMTSMLAYGERWGAVHDYCVKTRRPLHSEKFLRWYLRQRRLWNAACLPVLFSRVRADGRVHRDKLRMKEQFTGCFYQLFTSTRLAVATMRGQVTIAKEDRRVSEPVQTGAQELPLGVVESGHQQG